MTLLYYFIAFVVLGLSGCPLAFAPFGALGFVVASRWVQARLFGVQAAKPATDDALARHAFQTMEAADLLPPEKLVRPALPGQATFVRWDGEKTDVDCLRCTACKNYFWVQGAEIDPPRYCCYCGTRYDGIRVVSDEEMRDGQSL